MIFSDGECPNCGASQLHLNTSDFLECPRCHLVCANIDGLIATVMPFLGNGNFRFEDCNTPPLKGTAFAKAVANTVFPDLKKIFSSQKELAEYISTFPPGECANQCLDESLSIDFISEFQSFISNCPKEELKLAFDSKPGRTSFYSQRVMPAIADKLGLIHGKEEFKVDYVMSEMSRFGHAIPKIYIESENDYESAAHEVLKLCSLNSPVRVLITFTSKGFGTVQTSPAHQNLREWQSIVRSHSELNSQFQGIIVVLVGRIFNASVEFHACAFKQNGDLLMPLSKLVLRDIG